MISVPKSPNGWASPQPNSQTTLARSTGKQRWVLVSPTEPLEPVHIHGVSDTSTHLCLPVERASVVCELGWGEAHPFGDFGTEIMVYGPRDEEELEIVLSIIEESLNFARALN